MSQKLAELFDALAKFSLDRRKVIEAKRGRRCREYHVLTAEINAYWNCRDLARNAAGEELDEVTRLQLGFNPEQSP